MQKYTGERLNDIAYLTIDDETQLYAVIDFAHGRGRRVVGTASLP